MIWNWAESSGAGDADAFRREMEALGALPLYAAYEMTHAALAPARILSDVARLSLGSPLNPFGQTSWGRQAAAAVEIFERATRRYEKPAFSLDSALVGGERVPVREEVVWERPFCRLLHFARELPAGRRPDPKMLLVAPMSGHYATLLRGTVAGFLPNTDVYVTDWADARMVSLDRGGFDLDDYIDYVQAMLRLLGRDTHVVAVCQPAVPVLAAVARMAEDADPTVPRSMTLMGGPIDCRNAPTRVNELATERGLDWFRRTVISRVPFPHPGVMRPVYPGFLQLTGFMSMNLPRHVEAHGDLYNYLIAGDGEGANKHREFYDEYLSVMDLTAEFYLQTIETVFIRYALALGQMRHRDLPVNPAAITRTALLTVEGEKDDITGHGQTHAAHGLCTGLPENMKAHYTQEGAGHYGVFNGSRFRAEIAPRISDFIRSHAGGTD